MSASQPFIGSDLRPHRGELEPSCKETLRELFGSPTHVSVTTMEDQAIPSSLRERASGKWPGEQKSESLITVNCGPAFGGVAAACFPHEDKLRAFVDKTPSLKSSLVTIWAGAPMLWLRSDFLPG